MKANRTVFHILYCLTLWLSLSTKAWGARVGADPAEILRQLGHPTDTVQQILLATKNESFFVRHQALEVLARRIGKEAIPTLKASLADPHVRVRSRSAHLLGTLGDKSGVEQMRRDLKEFAPSDGASPIPDPNDPNVIASAIKEGRGGRDDRFREALIIAQVLAELGDHSGYQLAAKAALEERVNVVRTHAIFALVEIAKADKVTLSKEGIDPVSVLCKVAASEQQPGPFGVLIGTAQKLHPEAAIRILEKAKDSARQSALNRQVAEIALARVKGEKSPSK